MGKRNKREVISLYDHKRKAKKDLYYWTYNRYMKLLTDFENNENENPDLLDEIYKLQDRLNLYLKRWNNLLALNLYFWVD